MTISVKLNDTDAELIKAYSEKNNISLSELARSAVLEKIENEIDLDAYYRVMKNKKTIDKQ